MSTLVLNPHLPSQGSSPLSHQLTEQSKGDPALNLLHDAMTLVTALRAGQEVDQTQLHTVLDQLNQQYPEMESYDFLHSHHSYTDLEWEGVQSWIAGKQKQIIDTFYPHLKKPETITPVVRSSVHPGYHIIEVGEKYEKKQIELIVKHDAENQRTIAKLNQLNDALNLMMALRDKKTVDPEKLKTTFDQLNKQFPDLQLQDFLATHMNFTDEQWNHAQESVTNKEKILMAGFNPKMMEIEELISDKNKVHEILAEIIKQLNELGHYLARRQLPGG